MSAGHVPLRVHAAVHPARRCTRRTCSTRTVPRPCRPGSPASGRPGQPSGRAGAGTSRRIGPGRPAPGTSGVVAGRAVSGPGVLRRAEASSARSTHARVDADFPSLDPAHRHRPWTLLGLPAPRPSRRAIVWAARRPRTGASPAAAPDERAEPGRENGAGGRVQRPSFGAWAAAQRDPPRTRARPRPRPGWSTRAAAAHPQRRVPHMASPPRPIVATSRAGGSRPSITARHRPLSE